MVRFYAIVILILDERSDPRLLGKMISLTSVFLWEQRARRRRSGACPAMIKRSVDLTQQAPARLRGGEWYDRKRYARQ